MVICARRKDSPHALLVRGYYLFLIIQNYPEIFHPGTEVLMGLATTWGRVDGGQHSENIGEYFQQNILMVLDASLDKLIYIPFYIRKGSI